MLAAVRFPREAGLYQPPATGARPGGDTPAVGDGPLPHAGDPMTGAAAAAAGMAVIPDFHVNPAGIVAQRHRGTSCPAGVRSTHQNAGPSTAGSNYTYAGYERPIAVWDTFNALDPFFPPADR